MNWMPLTSESKNWKMKAIEAMQWVLKANALDFARRIDELRCVLQKIKLSMSDASFAKRPRCDTCQPLKNGAGRYGEEEKTSSSRVVKRRRSHTEDDGER